MNTSHPNNCLVVVPMKDPAISKTRLRSSLKPSQRSSLARLLYKRTLETLKLAQELGDSTAFDLAVVTNSKEAEELALSYDVTVIDEGPVQSLSLAVSTAAQWAQSNGYGALCMFPADLAAPDPSEIYRFVTLGLETGSAIVCPSTDMGTNGLFLAPPTAIDFSFGENSAVLHLQALKNAGISSKILPLESLKIDIDTSDCLEQSAERIETLSSLLAGQ